MIGLRMGLSLGGFGPSGPFAPTISGLTVDEPNSEVEFNLSRGSDVKWQVDDVASYGSPAAMDSTTGAAYASGTFSAASGSVVESIDLSGVTSGSRYMHIYAEADGLFSDVESFNYTQT